ncbi:hypothetical protein FB45DRAFT_554296 [Roridomyces roridus]|uniref:Mediator of RNA polymerase II transcription subunit 5 n=1 Tax=Roridomyces roridus TaxID=1738132 RepID=A0AAD7BUY3_9AGAR|nr:hypothetical protein FB45DRAFT_554296 [Roridomyces roridus]
MSLVDDLTRNSFQGGLSAPKWMSLCKMFLAKQNPFDSPHATERALSNSVLVLYRSFPGDPDLQEYVKIAIQSGLVSIPVFVSTFLQAARSTELHAPATLDMLCRVALDAHYSSGLLPEAALLSDGPMAVSNTLQDALALLRVAYDLPISHFHQLGTSVSELVILLFSAADMAQVPTSQATVLLSDLTSMINHNSISQDVRQALESFALPLSFLMGDDAKVAPEAHLVHSFQLALGKSDMLGPNSNTDIISFSLTLSYLVAHRADEFGAGSGNHPSALLVSMFRWTSWAPPVFYTQLLLSAFACLSESAAVSPLIWRAFVVGRLPFILHSFEKILSFDNATPENWRAALQVAVSSLLRRSELLERCDRLLNQSARAQAIYPEDMALSRTLARDFLRQLFLSGLLDQNFVLAVDPAFSNDTTMYLHNEAQDAGFDLETYLSSKLSSELEFDNVRVWVQKIWNDASAHKTFVDVAIRLFKTSAATLDTESLSHMCRIFYLCDAALDMIAMHSRVAELIFEALVFLQDCDFEIIGDPQTAVGHLGDVVLFVQSTLTRFHLETDMFTFGGRSLSSSFLRTTATVHRLNQLLPQDRIAFNMWYKVLFDSGSEGIEDTILRSTPPRTLLRISASLFSHAIKDTGIDEDVLNNGIAYFTGPLLRWTLVGVVLALSREIQLQGYSAPRHFSVLQTLLLSSQCPIPVHRLCGPKIILLLADKRVQGMAPSIGFDALTMHRIVADAMGIPNGATSQASLDSPFLGPTQPRQTIRDAISKARSSKAPALDVERLVKVCGCEKFISILWSELLNPASLADTDVCTRIATFALTIPRPLTSPPLLAIFLNVLLPGLVSTTDAKPVGEQPVAIDVLGSIIASVLMASFHLDLAFSEVSRPILGQPSLAMARRVAAELRSRAKKQSNAARLILQRLGGSHSFVANFPVFKMT